LKPTGRINAENPERGFHSEEEEEKLMDILY
jgi:hypothetical protein